MILADSGVLLAAANQNEKEHEACATLIEDNVGALMVSPLVVAEVCYMLSSRHSAEAEALFLDSFADGTLLLARLSEVDMLRMAALVRRYSDMRLGASDVSIVALGERLGLVQVATLDRRHFTVIRPVHCDTFSLLPE
jgi:predicted nucleic acid-binding protein